MIPYRSPHPMEAVCLLLRLLAALAFLVLAGLLDGCAHVALPGPPWTEDFARVEVPELPEIPDDAPPAEAVDAGRPAPFEGVLLDPREADQLVVAADQRDILVDALDLAYLGRAEDRAAAEAVLAAREEQIRQARAGQARWFVVGVGAGGGAVTAVLLAVLLAR